MIIIKHFGDITQLHGDSLPVVNVIIGGSPCQDLSMAGKRAGLAGERSGLFMEQIRIIKEMREKDAQSGRNGEQIRPRFMVWENVCFSGETIITTSEGPKRIDEIEFGDNVLTHMKRLGTVLEVYKTENVNVFKLSAVGMPDTIVTKNHPVLAGKIVEDLHHPGLFDVKSVSWYRVDELDESFAIAVLGSKSNPEIPYCPCAGYRCARVKAITDLNEMRTVYNLGVGGDNSYVANGFVVHNCGALSVNDGRDFAAVLEETIRIAEPEAPDIYVPRDGWTLSGAYVGRGWSVAWRVLDAQFWGVPQRRRRIALIADFGGQCAPKVLFESSCSFRHLKPSGAQGQGTAGDVANCPGTSSIECGKCRRYRGSGILRESGCAEHEGSAGGTGSGILNAGDPQSKHIYDPESVCGTLCSGTTEGMNIVPSVMQEVYCLDQGGNRSHVGISKEIAPTLAATHDGAPVVTDTIAIEGNGSRESHKGNGYAETDQMYTLNTVEQHSVCYGISAYESNAMLSSNPHSGVYEADTARTLDLNGGNPACNQGGIASVEDQTQSAGFCPNMGAKAEGIGYAEAQSPTLRTNADVGVVYPDVARTLTARNDGSPCIDRGPDVICVEMSSTKNTVSDDGVSPTLTARAGTGGNQVNAVVQQVQDNPDFLVESETADTLLASYSKGCGATGGKERTIVGFSKQRIGQFIEDETASTLLAHEARDVGDVVCAAASSDVRTRYIVRRLTVTECTRLQGFPDGWTDIGEWIDSKGKKHKDADSLKYKALGNSIAIPPWLFVLGELNKYCDDKGMGSLFDGIGGFPLIWSFLNGKENCLFASEIDEFCNAVSRLRFPDTSDCSKKNSPMTDESNPTIPAAE